MVGWQALMNGGTCPPPCTNCSQITLFEVSPANSLNKGKTTSKCLQVCVGIVYDATVSMSTLLLGGGGHRWMFKLKCSKLRIYSLEFAVSPSSVASFCCVCDNSTVGAWQVLPEVTGSEGVDRGGCWQPLLCVCVGACFGVGQRDFRRYDGWVRLGCIEKESYIERGGWQALTYFPLNLNLEGNVGWR